MCRSPARWSSREQRRRRSAAIFRQSVIWPDKRRTMQDELRVPVVISQIWRANFNGWTVSRGLETQGRSCLCFVQPLKWRSSNSCLAASLRVLNPCALNGNPHPRRSQHVSLKCVSAACRPRDSARACGARNAGRVSLVIAVSAGRLTQDWPLSELALILKNGGLPGLIENIEAACSLAAPKRTIVEEGATDGKGSKGTEVS